MPSAAHPPTLRRSHRVVYRPIIRGKTCSSGAPEPANLIQGLRVCTFHRLKLRAFSPEVIRVVLVSKINTHLLFLCPLCELLLLFASCRRSRSICCWAFQAGHHFPCQAIILPTIVAGFSLAYRHKRHPSHALPKNCSSRFIFDLQCSRKSRDRENLQSNRVTAKIESSSSFVLNGPV